MFLQTTFLHVQANRKGAAPPNAAPRIKKRGAVKDKLFPAFILRRGAAQRSGAPAMINSKVYLFFNARRGVRWGRTYWFFRRRVRWGRTFSARGLTLDVKIWRL